MKYPSKILALLAIVLSASVGIYNPFHGTQRAHPSRKLNFSYRDGLFYTKNGSELFTGVIVDTADVIISFEVVNGRKNGAFITFYRNGHYEKYGRIANNKNEGEWRYFYPNGRLESVGDYRSNKASGKWTFYYPNGSVRADGMYINGLKQGAWMYYDTRGRWKDILFFFNGSARRVLETV